MSASSIPELIPRRSLLSALRGRTAFYLKLRLLGEPQVVITDVPVVPEPGQTDGRPLLPRTTEALVFISSVHDPAIRAINYARSLRAMDVRAVFFALDAQEIEDIGNQWAERRVPVALDIVEAPFREPSQHLSHEPLGSGCAGCEPHCRGSDEPRRVHGRLIVHEMCRCAEFDGELREPIAVRYQFHTCVSGYWCPSRRTASTT